ncbi:zinc ABC transporter substrate-binding protein [bacterium]|nr:zinc ABC transporter substrate-binding protein [bacterium]
MKKIMKIFVLFLALFVLISCGEKTASKDSAASSEASTAAKKRDILNVTVSIPPQAYIVKSVGKDKVRVNTMMEPSSTPETYEPGPKKMADLKDSALYLKIGVPFEAASIEKLAADYKNIRFADMAKGINFRKMEGHFHPHHHCDKGCAEACADCKCGCKEGRECGCKHGEKLEKEECGVDVCSLPGFDAPKAEEHKHEHHHHDGMHEGCPHHKEHHGDKGCEGCEKCGCGCKDGKRCDCKEGKGCADCKCGCKEGKECACHHGDKGCGEGCCGGKCEGCADCKCGCKEGKECKCHDGKGCPKCGGEECPCKGDKECCKKHGGCACLNEKGCEGCADGKCGCKEGKECGCHHGKHPFPPHFPEMHDPHVWLDPMNLIVMTDNTVAELSAADPDNAAFYRENGEALKAEIKKVNDEVAALLKDVEGKSFVVHHPAFGYFADRFGLKQIPLEVEGKEPGAIDMAKVVDFIKKNEAKAVFMQAQIPDSVIKSIAEETKVRVITLDPLKENVLENIRETASEIKGALN